METSSEGHAPLHKEQQQQCVDMADAHTVMNFALSDAPRFGWAAVGGVVDLLTPHQRSQRRGTAVLHRKLRRRRANAKAPNPAEDPKKVTPQVLDSNRTPTPMVIDPKTQKLPSLQGTVGVTAPKNGLSTQTVSALKPVLAPAPPGNPSVDTLSESNANGTDTSIRKPLESNIATNANVTGVAHTVSQPPTTAPSTNQVPPESILPAKLPQLPGQNGNANVAALPKILQSTSTTGVCYNENAAASSALTKLLGPNAHLSGLTVKKKMQEEGTRTKVPCYECQVESIDNEGVLDMYTYHRGRESFEPRDPESGALLCPREPTDTNDDFDAPRSTLSVVVEFPLEDDDDESAERAMYKDTIQWNLFDPSTPSPLVFARNIANEYGLNHAQMMDIALSVQQQIDVHAEQHFNFCTPITTKDPYGNERRYTGTSVLTHRYGRVLPTAPGGTRIVRKERQRIQTLSRQSSISSSTGSARRKPAERKSIERVVVDYESEVEEVYRDQVKERSVAASTKDIMLDATSGTTKKMTRKDDFHCHICHKRCKVSFMFGCDNAAHCYCELHCKARLGPSFNAEDPSHPFCPICSLTCSCSKCQRKLETVARALKKESEQQGVEPAKTVFLDILTKNQQAIAGRAIGRPVSRKKDDAEGTATPKGRNKKSTEEKTDVVEKLLIPKPAITEFPREICGALELEPGTPDDYLKVYTWKGIFIADDFPQIWSEQMAEPNLTAESLPSSNGELVEDGNVDYCQVCKNHGNLLCCDYCPRAFHVDCIEGDTQSTANDRWECHICQKEKLEMDIDTVNGKDSLDLICASFVDVDATSDTALKSMEVMSIIHAMLKELMTYDFGYMFAEPVDAEAIPGYRDIVEKPMDLGTIASKLINAGYTNIVKNGGTFDDVLIAILDDIELVWHNCFSFNFEGSAIYRMAAVQHRRAKMMRLKSFESLLNDKVKEALSDYIKSCESKRTKFSGADEKGAEINEKERELRARRPKGKHKITVKAGNSSINRAVAILDPVTGRIVKIYSSMKSAGQAAHSMITCGHRCEFPTTHDLVRQVVLKSSSDPSILLFGYRWLMLDDLRLDKVNFEEPSHDGVELRYKGLHYAFPSIDEAVSSSLVSKLAPIAELRSKLRNVTPGPTWVELFGVYWRRVDDQMEVTPRAARGPGEEKSPFVFETISADVLFPHDKSILKHSAVIKHDLVLDKSLTGFDSIESAFEDWKEVASFSPSFPVLEEKTIGNFREYYLDGDRNIDGLVWRTQEPEARKDDINNVGIAKENGVAPLAPVTNGIAPAIEMTAMDTENQNKKRKREEQPCEKKSISNDMETSNGNTDQQLHGTQLFKNPKLQTGPESLQVSGSVGGMPTTQC